MAKPTCLYYGPSFEHRLYNSADSIVRTYFNQVQSIWYHPDVVISFLSDKILKGPILDIPNINFHPAPPKYPGRGGASYALFNGDTKFGATAHRMVEKIDAGLVYKVRYVSICSNDTCETLFAKAEDACLHLLTDFCIFYNENRCMPETDIAPQWQGPAKTRKDFQEFLDCGEVAPYSSFDLETIKRVIKATKHSKFPGPYVTVAGYKFELSKEQNVI